MSVKARPQDYAAAIYDLAFEAWSRPLHAVQQALAKDRDLRAALDDPRKPVEARLKLLEQAVPGGLNPEVRKFLGTLLESGQINQLDAILAEFERLVRRRPERKLAQVTSAIPLTEDEKAALRARLIERFGPDLEFEFKVDKSVLGGIYLRVGDQVIDGTVAGKLAALRDRLAA